ncbi:hypothetical protein DDE82_000507 [Stemphylium lycopersici]|nr:hypothetical protein TW65_00772 [Stemphylium lycopersici]RAR11562.1 hypothetical protein DDE82_000507 [Stemphylium lycopersici]
MAPPLTIPSTSPPIAQQILIQTYIFQNTYNSTFFDHPTTFLSNSAITALATRANITAMLCQDADLSTRSFPSHSRAFLATRLATEAQKIFVIAISERLSMGFLRVLLREGNAGDNNLPLPDTLRIRNENNEFWPDAHLKAFLAAQKTVLAPVFTLGEFAQSAPCRAGLPVVSAKRAKVEWRDGSGRVEIWEVEFHAEHLRVPRWAKKGEEELEGRKFLVRALQRFDQAVMHRGYGKRVFGFSCEKLYYLVCDP